jgi:hypothetical protein
LPSIVRWFTRERFAYLAVYAALSVMFCWPLFAQPYAGGTGDWDQHTFYYASVFRTLAHGQLPFWNPWYCGGNVLWQNPQVSLVSPVYLLALLMPFTLAMKLNVAAHYFAGCLGMHLVVRRIAGVRSPAIVVYAVALFVFSGGLALHIRTGHVNFLPVFLLPALVYCFYRAIAGHAPSLIAGGVIAGFAALNGGAHVVPIAAILLGSLGLGALVAGRTLRPLLIAVLIVIGGCAFAAPKLVPAALFITSADFQDRRPVKRPDFMSVDMLRRALADGSQGTDLKVPGGVQKYAWHEYGNYMGWFGIGLSVISAMWLFRFVWRRDRWREVSAAIALVLVVIVAAGEFAPWAPAALLRALPGFSNFRIPSRNILLVPLVGAMCLAFATRLWQDRVGGRRVQWLLEVVCLVGICQLMVVNREAYRDVFLVPVDGTETRLTEDMVPVVAEREPPSAALSRLGENSNLMRSMAEGVSPLNCYEQLMVRRMAKPGPATITGDVAAVVSDVSFTPNRVTARVRTDRDGARVVLNQNFADGWSTNVGSFERDPESGRPSAVLPAAFDGTVAFTFAPPGFWPGLTIWLVAVAASIVIWRRSAR